MNIRWMARSIPLVGRISKPIWRSIVGIAAESKLLEFVPEIEDDDPVKQEIKETIVICVTSALIWTLLRMSWTGALALAGWRCWDYASYFLEQLQQELEDQESSGKEDQQ